MSETHQGYDLPYTADPSYQIAFIGIGLIALVASIWFYRSEGEAIILLVVVLFLVMILAEEAALLARIRITPEGIAVTLFSRTVRCIPAESVCLIAGVRKYESKANPHDLMAVCINTAEELAELGNRHMPKLLKCEADRWYGEAAAKYLYRHAVSFGGELNLYKHILWLDWSTERLEMLRQMYPDAQWLDCTQKKIFDAQLKK